MATTRPCQVSPFYLFLGSRDYSLAYEGRQYRASLFAVGLPVGFGSDQLRWGKGCVSPACCVGHAWFKDGRREPRRASLCTEASGWLLSCPLTAWSTPPALASESERRGREHVQLARVQLGWEPPSGSAVAAWLTSAKDAYGKSWAPTACRLNQPWRGADNTCP